MRSSRMVPAAVLAATVFAAGCGDDDSSSSAGDEREVRSVVQRWASTTATPATCRTVFSAKFATDVYGGLPECISNAQDNDDDEALKDVRVSEVKVDGDGATVRMQGTSRGILLAGEVQLVKQSDRWRVDALGEDFVRSVLNQVFGGGIKAALDDNDVADSQRLVDDARLKPCADTKLAALQDGQARRIAYSILGNRDDKAVEGPLRTALADCLRGTDGGQTILLRIAEAGIASRVGAGAPCIIERLRRTSREAMIAASAAGLAGQEPTPAQDAALQRGAEAAAATCQAQRPRR